MDIVMKKIVECGIIPVIVINDASKAVSVARALLKGGINVMEITLRTSDATQAISLVSKEVPEMLVGAGTVLNENQYAEALGAGAKFMVSPGLDSDVVKRAIIDGVPIIPGTVTPSEIMAGLRLGLTLFKFFPADIYGGLKAMKALSAPFGKISFVPTGGINENNLAEFIAAPFVSAVGGSWMAPAQLIDNGEYDEIVIRCARACEIVKNACGTRA